MSGMYGKPNPHQSIKSKHKSKHKLNREQCAPGPPVFRLRGIQEGGGLRSADRRTKKGLRYVADIEHRTALTTVFYIVIICTGNRYAGYLPHGWLVELG